MGELVDDRSLGQQQLKTLVQMALDEALKLGADQAYVAASLDSVFSVTARLGVV
jgi:hypothetical protein